MERLSMYIVGTLTPGISSTGVGTKYGTGPETGTYRISGAGTY